MGSLWLRELSAVFISDPALLAFLILCALWQPFVAHCALQPQASPLLALELQSGTGQVGHDLVGSSWFMSTPPHPCWTLLRSPCTHSRFSLIICITQIMGAIKSYQGKKWQHHLDLKDTVTNSLLPLGTPSISCNSITLDSSRVFTQVDCVYPNGSSQKQNSDTFVFVAQPCLK